MTEREAEIARDRVKAFDDLFNLQVSSRITLDTLDSARFENNYAITALVIETTAGPTRLDLPAGALGLRVLVNFLKESLQKKHQAITAKIAAL